MERECLSSFSRDEPRGIWSLLGRCLQLELQVLAREQKVALLLLNHRSKTGD
jgi:hypothetical protein